MRRFLAVAVALSLVVLAASCSGGSDFRKADPVLSPSEGTFGFGCGQEPYGCPGEIGSARGPVTIPHAVQGGTITVLTHDGLAGTLDPAGADQPDVVSLLSGLVTRSLTQYRYDPRSKQMVLVPDLATDLGRHNDDYTEWSYTLRPGVRFEDGTKVTRDDVVRGVRRCGAGRAFATSPCLTHERIVSVEPGHRRTILFHFAHPFPDLPYLAATPAIGPVPPGTSFTYGPYAQHPMATGPYRVEQYRRGHLLVLTRNPVWDPETDPGRTQYPDEYVVRSGVSADEIAGVLAADTGDGTTTLTYDDVPVTPADRRDWRQQRLVLGANPCTTYLAPDSRTVTALAVRRALVLAYPYRAVLRAEGLVPGVTAVPATNLVPPGVPGRTSLTVAGHPGFATDPVAARRLLAGASALGARLRFLYTPGDRVSLRTRDALVRSLTAAGFDPDPVRGGPVDLRTATPCGSWPTGSEWVRPVYRSIRLTDPSLQHRMRMIDRLPLDQMAAPWNRLDRDIMRHRQPVVPLWYGGVAMRHGSRIQGMADDTVLGMPTWGTLWVSP